MTPYEMLQRIDMKLSTFEDTIDKISDNINVF